MAGATSVQWLHGGKRTTISANGISRQSAAPISKGGAGQPAPVGATRALVPALTHPLPLVHGPDWNVQYPAGQPTERTGAALALMPSGSAPLDVMFGGFGRRGRAWDGLAETWIWDGARWTPRSPATSPSGRAGAAMAYDPALGTVILYGGWDGASSTAVKSDTWAWNGTTWTQLTPAGSPGPLAFASMTYDSALGKLVLFGGATALGQSPAFAATGLSWATAPAASGQTWTFDGTTWTQLSPTTSPPARSSSAAAYDPVSGTVVLYGGYSPTGTTLGDTWTFDGATWTSQAPTNSPAAVSNAAMAYDATLKSLVLFGGADAAGNPTNVTSLWDSTQHSWIWNYSDIVPAARQGAALAPAAVNGQLLMFGGEFAPQSVADDSQLLDWGQRGASTGNQRKSFTVDDRLTLSVDLGSGNLYAKQEGIRLASTGQTLESYAQYNSQYAANQWMDSPWYQTLRYGPGGSMELDGVGGSEDSLPFYADGAGGFISPPDLNASLQYVAASNSYELIFAAPSQQVIWFASPADDGSGAPGLVSRITNHAGDQTTITGNLSTGNATVVDSRGRTISRTQSSSGATWTFPDGRSWSEGAIVSHWQNFTDSTGSITQFGYDAVTNKLTAIIDPAGHSTAISYDANGKVASVSQGSAGVYTAVTTFTWAPVVFGTSVPSGTTAQFETQMIDPNGHRARFVNQYSGQTILTVDPFGQTNSATYNSAGLPTTDTDANGDTATAAYSATVVTDQVSTTAPPSSTGQSPAVVTATYNTPATVFDYQHLPSSSTDADGNCTARIYDPAGNVTDSYTGQASPCDGATGGIHIASRYQGDAGVTSCGGLAGQLCSSTNGNGQTTSYSYDSTGNRLTETPPAPQHSLAYTYDSSSRIATITDGAGIRRYTYDNADRVTQVRYAGATTCTPSAGTCITYSYDANGNRSQMVDVSGTSTWTYDSLNRVTKEVSPTAPVNSCSSPADSGIIHTYDALDNEISTCDNTGTTNYGYDSEGRLRAAATPITQVGFSSAFINTSGTLGLPLPTRGGDQIMIGVTMPAGGGVTTPTGYTVVGTYGTGGTIEEILTRTAAAGDTSVTITSSTSYPYTLAVVLGVYRGVSPSTPVEAVSSASATGTVLTVAGVTTTGASDKLLLFAGRGVGDAMDDVTPSSGMSVDQNTIGVGSGPIGSLSSQWLTRAGATGTVTGTYQTSADREGVLVALKPVNTTQVPITYTYDHDGNRLSTNYPDGVSQNMTYNHAGQLTDITAVKNSTGAIIASYSYLWRAGTSDRDQRQSVTNNVTGRTTTYTYDAFKRLTRARDTAGGTNDYQYTYDNDGNLKQQNRNGVITTAAFNAADQLCWTVTGVSANPCATAPSGAKTYTYDTSGNLTASSAGFAGSYNALNQSSSITPAGGTATAMKYAGDGQDSRTQAGSTLYVNAGDNVLSQSTSGVSTSYLTEPGAQTPSRITTSTGTYYYLYDGEQNVIGLVDSTGTRQATYSYDPYGATTATGAAAAANPFRFAGGYQDATGLYHYGARYYDPATARWTQLDPTAQDAAYVYAADDPINRSDLSGTTNNVNGRSCHWWGCDFRLSNSRAQRLVDLLNVGAGASAACGIIATSTGYGAPLGLICGLVSAVLWMYAGYIQYLIDTWHRGIYFRVYYWLSWYVWHQ